MEDYKDNAFLELLDIGKWVGVLIALNGLEKSLHAPLPNPVDARREYIFQEKSAIHQSGAPLRLDQREWYLTSK